MFFRAAVLSLLGCLLFLHLESEVRHAGVAATTPAVSIVMPGPAAPAPPSPVPPPAEPQVMHSLVAPETRLIDISGQELDRLFTETDPMRAARIVPSLHHGERRGVKLYAVRPGSLFDAIGLRNADTLVAVDDGPVEDVDHIADLAARASEARWIDLALIRNGLPLRIVVLVHR